jgi:hypothetical protein
VAHVQEAGFWPTSGWPTTRELRDDGSIDLRIPGWFPRMLPTGHLEIRGRRSRMDAFRRAGWVAARCRRKPGAFGHRLPGEGARSVGACGCCIHLLLSGLLSVAGPVRRALRIDPANVLREQ